MNKKLGLAVAGAVMAFASVANAGISIPAGEWTLDVHGNVNGFGTSENVDRAELKTTGAGVTVNGGIASGSAGIEQDTKGVRTGLLPSWFGVSGKTRQNDIDVGFTIGFQPGIGQSAGTNAAIGNNVANFRQVFLTFGDASWGTFKVGRDLGLFGSDAILSDMTLLGVGSGSGGGSGTTTLGRIGSGYMYADWVPQISYASPNWNGFSFAAGVFGPFVATGDTLATAAATTTTATTLNGNEDFGYQAKAAYEWTGDVSGKAWVGFMQQDATALKTTAVTQAAAAKYDISMHAWEIGAKVATSGFELVGYYYDGQGVGIRGIGENSFTVNTATGQVKERDGNGYYVQATYKLPTVGTKLGVSYGQSTLDQTSTEKTMNNTAAATASLVDKNRSWVVGAYHPLTKSLNLVAEYTKTESQAHNSNYKDAEQDTVALGAILFF